MTYVHSIIVAVFALTATGCATTPWTRAKLETTEDRLRAATTEQFAEYERRRQSELAEIDQALLQLTTQLALLEDGVASLQDASARMDEQATVSTRQCWQHMTSSEVELATLVTLTRSLDESFAEFTIKVAALEREGQSLKDRWRTEAAMARQWHRGVATMLLDAIARAAEEPLNEERQDNPALSRLSSMLRQLALDMQTQLDISRRTEYNGGPADAISPMTVGHDDES